MRGDDRAILHLVFLAKSNDGNWRDNFEMKVFIDQ